MPRPTRSDSLQFCVHLQQPTDLTHESLVRRDFGKTTLEETPGLTEREECDRRSEFAPKHLYVGDEADHDRRHNHDVDGRSFGLRHRANGRIRRRQSARSAWGSGACAADSSKWLIIQGFLALNPKTALFFLAF